MDTKKLKMYLKDPSKAILDAKNFELTETEVQNSLDALYDQLTPKPKGTLSGIGSFLTNIYQWDAYKITCSQDYLDSRVKPFIKKMNKELHWNLKQYDDFIS